MAAMSTIVLTVIVGIEGMRIRILVHMVTGMVMVRQAGSVLVWVMSMAIVRMRMTCMRVLVLMSASMVMTVTLSDRYFIRHPCQAI